MDYRIKLDVNVVSFPTGFEEESRGLKGCCDCKQLVLAHAVDNETWKNDITGAYIKKGDVADSVAFVMTDSNGVVVANLGDVGIFPNDPLAAAFIYDWKQILIANGIGCYTIKIVFTISGIAGGFTWGIYDLKSYSVESAKKTVRIRTAFNSFYQLLKIDFTDSNFTDSVRFKGLFGDVQPNTDIKNLIGINRKVLKSTRENVNKWSLRTEPLSICFTRQLTKFHFLNEDDCFISDHNPTNHDYLLFDVPVVVTESSEIGYIEGSRLAKVTATFGDRSLQDKNYYNQQ